LQRSPARGRHVADDRHSDLAVRTNGYDDREVRIPSRISRRCPSIDVDLDRVANADRRRTVGCRAANGDQTENQTGDELPHETLPEESVRDHLGLDALDLAAVSQ